MKNKHLLFMLALPVAFAACSDDELQTLNNNQVVDGEMVATADLTLTASKSFGEAESRANWVKGEDSYAFHWTAATDAVGLAYVGEGTAAVTNYNFVVDSIYDGRLVVQENAAYTTKYQKIGETSSVAAAWKNSYKVKIGAADPVSYDAASHIISSSEYAKFKTGNDYILKGKYVAYFPAVGSNKFAETGNIPVESPASLSFTTVAENLTLAAANTFQYSQKVDITTAGSQVTHFTLNPLSSVFNIQVTTKLDKTIKTVIIAAKNGEKFITKASLNGIPATANKDALTNIDATASVAALTLSNTSGVTLDDAATEAVNFYMPVLPAAFTTGFDIIFLDEAGKAYTIEKAFKNGSFTIPSGQMIPMPVEIPANAEFKDYLATDATTFNAAVNSIITAAGTDDVTATIKLFNNITGAGNVNLTATNTIKLTIDGDCTVAVGAVTVPEGATLNIDNTKLTAGNVINEGTLNINGELEATGLTNEGTANVNAEAVVKGNLVNSSILNVNAEGELTVAGGATSSNTNTIDVFGKMNLSGNTVSTTTTYTSLSNTNKIIVRADAEFNNDAECVITNQGQLTCDGDFNNNGHIKEVGSSAVVTGMNYNQGETGAFSKVVSTADELKTALVNENTTSGQAYTTVYVTAGLTVAFDEDFTSTKGIIINDGAGDLTLNIKGGKTVTLASIEAANLTILNSDATHALTSIAKLVVNSGFEIASGKTLTVGHNTESTFNGALTNEAGTFTYEAVATATPQLEVKGILSCESFSGAGTWSGIPSIIVAE